MAEVRLQINPHQLEDCYSYLKYIKNGVDTVIMRAINKTLTGVRTDGVQILYDRYNLTKKRIRNAFAISKAKPGIITGKIAARVSTTGKSISLLDYGARPVKAGLSVKVLRSSPRSIIPGGFIAKMKSGKILSVWREWHKFKKPMRANFKYGRLPRKYRLPIKQLYGPRIQDYLGDDANHKKWQDMASERLKGHMAHEAEYLIKKKLEPGDGYSEAA